MRTIGIAILLTLTACGSETETEPATRPVPLVIYANATDETTLRDRFADFTNESGIPIAFQFGDSAANTNLVITNLGSPPADILLTDNVADIWRAAEQGALRPLQAEVVGVLHPTLRDPDRLWAALNVRSAAIEVAPQFEDQNPLGYEDLADPRMHGQLCLSSSSLPLNRSLIAMLIHEHGVRPTDLIVRGWVKNLAQPPFASEAKLREAAVSGACPVSIVSQPYRSTGRSFYVDVDGIGIGRHSRYPGSAHEFVKWLFEQSGFADFQGARGNNVGIAGWLDEDAVLLAERAGYR